MEDDEERGSPKDVDTIKFWLENVKVLAPTKTDEYRSSSSSVSRSRSKAGTTSRIIPRECRELGKIYSGPILGDFCFQVVHRSKDRDSDGGITETPGKVIRMNKKFGDMPIMVMSKACHLRAKKPVELVQMKEEVR